MTLDAQDVTVAGRLAQVSAELEPGAITAICGPNGAGKSTLLSCLAGLIAPDRGAVRLDGAALAAMPPRERARAIGYLPQIPEVAWDVSVETLVSLGRLPWKGADKGEAAQGVEQALAALDLEALRARAVLSLSGGERARALFARVLAGQPRWILADEPLANLDLAHAAGLAAKLRDQARAGTGVVLVLHELATAMNHADRVLVLDRGSLVADGPPAQALAAPVIEQVWGVKARWLGEPGSRALSLG